MSGLRKALIVANDAYEHDGLKHLLAPAADADALAGVLSNPQIGDFTVHVVRNEPAHVIQAQIEDLFSESRADDLLLLHFSCHGLKSESGELFFAARNTRPNRLGSSAISADFVQRCMRASRSRSIVLLLDCCYGGAFSQGVTVRAAGDVNVLDSFPGGRLGGGRGRAVITASSAMEYAFEGDHLADDQSSRPSVFTSALVEGLTTGDADRDQDGWVSLNELYDYVFDRVREQNPHQTPGRDVEMQGELYLARRSRPVTTPAPLPPGLQDVIDHPLANIRAGAVRELGQLKRGRHAGLALAATLALERLADDDSRTVATAAAAALQPVDEDEHERDEHERDEHERDEHEQDQAPPADPVAARPARPGAPPRSAAAADGQPGHPTGHPPSHRPGRASRLRHWLRRPIGYVIGAAVLLAAAAAAVLIPNFGGDEGDTTGEPEGPGRGWFAAEAPWRLVIRDNISGMDDGCDVTLTNLDNGEQAASLTDVYGTRAYQMHASGTFRYEANSPECLVIRRAGGGEATLPFAHNIAGDTDAFEAAGPVSVEVLDFGGNSACEFVLHDADDGQQLDFGTVRHGDGPLRLDPGGRSRVYVGNLYCGVRVSAG